MVNTDFSVCRSTKPSIENASSPERIEEGKEEHASPGSVSSWGSGEFHWVFLPVIRCMNWIMVEFCMASGVFSLQLKNLIAPE